MKLKHPVHWEKSKAFFFWPKNCERSQRTGKAKQNSKINFCLMISKKTYSLCAIATLILEVLSLGSRGSLIVWFILSRLFMV